MILFFVFRSSNPIFKYPFLILYTGFLFDILIFRKLFIGRLAKKFIIHYSLIIILFLIFSASFINSPKIFLSIFKDILNGIILLSFFLILSFYISTKDEFVILLKTFYKLIVVFACLIAIFGLFDTFGILPHSDYFLLERTSLSPLPYDYNFGSIPVILGLIVLLYQIKFENKLKIHLILYESILVIFSVFLILSGSKRGFIVLGLILLTSFSVSFFTYFRKDFLSHRSKVILDVYLLLIIFITFLFYFSINHVSYISKSNFLKYIGTKDIVGTRERISSNLFRYYNIFNKKVQLRDFHEKLWSIRFDPMNPDLGWAGIGTHKIVSSLSGRNIDIVPAGAKGLLIDNTFKTDSWNGDSYAITQIGRINADTTDKIITSIYCYVSEDFNGSSVKHILLYTKRKEIHSEYDLNYKGTWQKLFIEDDCMNEAAEARFYVVQSGEKNFSSLKGYVIIAFPQMLKIDKNGALKSYYNLKEQNVSCILDSKKTNIRKNFCTILINSKTSKSDVKGNNSEARNTNTLSLLQHNEPSFFLPDYQVVHNCKKLISSDFASFPILTLMNNYIIRDDNDPIRKWVAKLISEDTTFYPYKKNLHVDISSDNLEDNRVSHWEFAFQIYTKEYSLSQKIIGAGFYFLNWYGYYFYKDKTRSDYPHNPFLYILLYSGLLGLILYIYLLYKVFHYYLLYIKEYFLIYIFFLILYFFTFFSGGNPLDPPIMGFFMMLPFFIHYIHEKDKFELDEQIENPNPAIQ
jgi:hypothetical protein